MQKIVDVLRFIFYFMGMFAVCTFLFSIGNYAIEKEIIVYKYKWLIYPFYFGVGVLGSLMGGVMQKEHNKAKEENRLI